MPVSLSAAMRLFEARRYDEAERAFAALAGPTRDGVIARFRRAESLSRLGRHDEAIADARLAFADDPGHPPAPLWLAQALAEAGRLDEAAAVEFPTEDDAEIEAIARGFAMLPKFSAPSGDDADAVVAALLATRHSPLYSLALRVTEASRLAGPPYGPDLITAGTLRFALFEADDLGKQVHPELPPAEGEADLGSPSRWVRLARLTGGWPGLERLLRPLVESEGSEEEDQFEALLAGDDLAGAQALLDRLRSEHEDELAGEFCVNVVRVAQLRGEPVFPRDRPAFEDARRRLAPYVSWLDVGAALLAGDPLAARAPADSIADPSHSELVEAALFRWSVPGTA